MIYILRNKASGLFMADKYRAETADPHAACFYTSEKNAHLSVLRRKRTHKAWEPKRPGMFPSEFEIVPCTVTEVPQK
ncbi:MAG: hypothetical protein ACTHJ3_00740 [Pararhizobium sp.]